MSFGRVKWIAALVAAVVVAAPASVGAIAAGPFDGLSGVWSGDGTVIYASGTKERLRCRVQYVQKNENNLQQALRCASDSYKFEINAYFDSFDGQIQGTWAELVQEIRGTVTGTVSNGRIVGKLDGPGFVASLDVVTSGDRQQVNIAAEIEEIRGVSIEVRKVRGP